MTAPEQSATEHAATVREFIDWAVGIDSAADHWWFRDTEGLVAALDALAALAARAEEAEAALAALAYELDDGLCWCPSDWFDMEHDTGYQRPDDDHSKQCVKARLALGAALAGGKEVAAAGNEREKLLEADNARLTAEARAEEAEKERDEAREQAGQFSQDCAWALVERDEARERTLTGVASAIRLAEAAEAEVTRLTQEQRDRVVTKMTKMNVAEQAAAQAQADLVRLDFQFARLREAAFKVTTAYTAETEDHNDGEFALWKADDLVNAIVALRAALAKDKG